MKRYVPMKVSVSDRVIRKLHELRQLYRQSTNVFGQTMASETIQQLLETEINVSVRRALDQAIAWEKEKLSEAVNDDAA